MLVQLVLHDLALLWSLPRCRVERVALGAAIAVLSRGMAVLLVGASVEVGIVVGVDGNALRGTGFVGR